MTDPNSDQTQPTTPSTGGAPDQSGAQNPELASEETRPYQAFLDPTTASGVGSEPASGGGDEGLEQTVEYPPASGQDAGLVASPRTTGTPGPAQGTSYGSASARSRGAAASGASGGPNGKAPAALMVGSVIGLAVIVAVAAWFFLLRPTDNTALGSPSPSATAVATPTTEPTEEPTAQPTRTPRPTAAPTPFKAPRFTGLKLADAQLLADSRTIKLDIRYQERTDVAADTVLSQAPPEGSVVLPGDTVFLIVAMAGPTVRVPDVRGQSESDAVNALLEFELVPGDDSEAFDPDIAAGLVIGTDPGAGEEVARGSTVDYQLSLGPEPTPTPIAAPNLVGLSEADAQARVDALGLVLAVTLEPTDEAEPGIVLSQDPPPDADVNAGDTISVVVAEQLPTVRVPDVRGTSESDAVNALLEIDLVPGERSEAFDPDVEAGLVAGTDPGAGEEVDRGSSVAYVVSIGPEPTPTPTPAPTPIAAPNLVGLSQSEAQAQVDALGLVLAVTTEQTDRADPGTVLAQDPEPDAPLFSGDTISVVVAEQLPTVRVPDVRGQSESDAVNALLDADLTPGERSERFHDQIAAGLVIRTDPPADTVVDRGSPVAYVVSAGPEPTPTPTPAPTPIAAPNLVGLSEADARSRVDALGLVLAVTTEQTDRADPGTVLSQDPEPDAPLFSGDTISVVVAEQLPTVRVPDVRGTSESDAVIALLDADLTPGERSERFHEQIAQGLVIRTDPPADTVVDRGSPVAYVVSIGPEPTPTPTPAPTPIAAPNLVGMSEADARSRVDALGLVLAVTTEPTDGADPGTVLAQDPEPDADMFSGDTISVVVAEQLPTVRVPDVRGTSESDAVNALLDADLTPGERSERFHDQVAQGLVIRTDPPADTVVDRGSPVAYVVSIGPEPTPTPTPAPTPIAAPNLVGLSEADARSRVDALGLVLAVTTEPTDGADPGTVLAQDPEPDADMFSGDTISVVVAEQLPTVRVPDVRGTSESDAVIALLDADLTPGERSERFHEQIAQGLVIRTDPPADTVVDRGSPVAYVVSIGPEPTPTPTPAPTPIAAPNLVGLSEADARSRVDALGLVLAVTTEPTDGADPGTVLAQDPEPDAPLFSGDTISVVVAEQLPTVRVPDVRGTSESDAVNALLDADLTPGERSERFHDQVAQGLVIRTDPPAEAVVDRGSPVAYVVSIGPEPTPTPTPAPTPIAAPNLVGMSEADARSRVDALGLVLAVTTEPTDGADPGTVLAQDPEPDADMFSGDTISVVVAEQLPTVRVPDVRGTSESDAVNALLDADLTPGERSERFHDQVAQGLVIRTDPPADTVVDRGSPVAYVVSAGPEPTPTPTPAPTPIAAPNLVGLSEADARSRVDALGLVLAVTTEQTDQAEPGTVLAQDPEPDAPLFSGDTISVVVAEQLPTVRVPDVRGTSESDAVNALLDADLTPGERSERFHDQIAAGLVIRTDPPADTVVDRGSPVAYVVSAGPEPTPTPTPAPTPIAAPNLVGLSQSEAQAQVDALGLVLAVTTEQTDGADPGTVLAQDPEPDADMFSGDTISVVVAEQLPTVRVPDVRGTSESDAVNALLDADLTPGERSERFHDQIAQGLVIRTDPPAEAVVDRGSSVAYVVSIGPEPTPTPTPAPTPIAAPNLVGQLIADARDVAESVGLTLDVTRVETDEADPGTVLSQDPPPETQLLPGDTISVTVARLPSTVAVPPLRGLSEGDAIGVLLDAGLGAGDRTEAFDPDLEAGLVVGTDPAEGTQVDRGSRVDYVVSLGAEPSTVLVPNVRGQSESDAISALVEAGLRPGARTERHHESVPRDAVIRTDPQADSEVELGTTIDYVMSLGPAPIRAPNLVGRNVDDARRIVDQDGLQIDVTFEDSNDDPDTVLSQDPPEGTELQPGDTIRVVVARQSSTVTVPRLRGLNEGDAVNALLDAGLTPGTRTERTSARVEAGLVISSDPEVGSDVERGSSVDYVISLGAESTPEPTREPTPVPTDGPEPSLGTGIQQTIDAVVAQVPDIRGIDPTTTVPYREITPRQFRRELQRQFDAQNPPEQVAAEETLLKRIGLLPEDADLRALVLQLYASQVAAFYDPDTGTFTIIARDDDFGAADRVFVAHEYEHALQDQTWGLNRVQVSDLTQSDRAFGHLALIEGDATAVMLDWALQNLSQEDLAGLGNSLTPTDVAVLDSMPPLLRRQLEFPYLDGYLFVTALRAEGDWDAVNAAWDKLPSSTEQIMHPEKYNSDKPVKVALPDVAAALGDGWTGAYLQTLGEMQTGVWVADGQGWDSASLPPLLPNAEAAAGWGGDRLVSLDGPDGSWAVAWQTDWDSAGDAEEFAAAADAAMGDLPSAHAVFSGADISGGLSAPVLVVIASDDTALKLVVGALGIGG